MHGTDPPEYVSTIHRFTEEIDRLTGEQIEAMKTSTFRVLTAVEAKEYEDRRAKILELVEQLLKEAA